MYMGELPRQFIADGMVPANWQLAFTLKHADIKNGNI